MAESELYPPVKRFLEAQGFAVKGEVRGADVVAVRPGEPPLLVIAELKLGLSLELILQAVDRLRTADEVWLAVPATRRGRDRDRRAHRLCRLLGVGLLAVTLGTGHVAVLAQPAPYRPRPNLPKRRLILREFARRQGDPNAGGITRRTIVTAYRQQAMVVAEALAAGPLRPRDLKARAPEAGAILARNYYGWFERVEKGVYALAPTGHAALRAWAGGNEGETRGIPGADGRVRP
jgi:hypothetical protein